MKHLKVYENFMSEPINPETLGVENPMSSVHFETESEDIISTEGNTEGNYFVNFMNSEGKPTTIEICGASDPEFVGDSMVSVIEMVPDSSSDGKSYNITGYYDEVKDSGKAYQLKKVLIEEL